MTPSTNEDLSVIVARSQRRFGLIVGVFVVVLSFVYGFVKGSSELAQASMPGLSNAVRIPYSQLSPELLGMLPRDSVVATMGTDMTLNGLPAEMISFTLERDLQSFVFEHWRLWKKRGFDAQQQSSDRRAISFAYNEETGVRASLVVWVVPANVRDIVSDGYALQGTLSLLYPGRERAVLPGVPSMFGASSGVVVASTDMGKRTYTGTFNNPGTQAESESFYDSALRSEGWNEVMLQGEGEYTQQRRYRKGQKEVTIVYAGVPNSLEFTNGGEPRTMVTIIVSVSKAV